VGGGTEAEERATRGSAKRLRYVELTKMRRSERRQR
jgi:hypothetical protein